MANTIFVTGGTGFIGSAIVRELLAAGHRVLGLARSEASAVALTAAGADVHHGDLEDLEGLRRGAAAADAVVHMGFIHDFARFKEVSEIDRRAVEALGSELLGSRRPLFLASGTALVAPGRLATEDDLGTLTADDFPRVATQDAANALEAQGVRVCAVRFSPSVHGDGDHGFVPHLINLAREKGVSAYIGDGNNRWNAVHRLDAARLIRLALDKDIVAPRFHAVAEEAIPFRDIAEAIGRGLNVPVVSVLPEEAAQHFGWFAHFAAIDCPASSRKTRADLGWQPTEPGLIADLDPSTRYFAAATAHA